MKNYKINSAQKVFTMQLKRSIQIMTIAITCLSATVVSANFCNGTLPVNTPNSDFIDHNDGTVTHTSTGLMWAKCIEGTSGADCSIGTSLHLDWENAFTHAELADLGGHSNWRIPSLKELTSIVETSCNRPAINESIFPNMPINTSGFDYMTSTPDAEHGDRTWYVSFLAGKSTTYRKDTSTGYKIRLVRNIEL